MEEPGLSPAARALMFQRVQVAFDHARMGLPRAALERWLRACVCVCVCVHARGPARASDDGVGGQAAALPSFVRIEGGAVGRAWRGGGGGAYAALVRKTRRRPSDEPVSVKKERGSPSSGRCGMSAPCLTRSKSVRPCNGIDTWRHRRVRWGSGLGMWAWSEYAKSSREGLRKRKRRGVRRRWR